MRHRLAVAAFVAALLPITGHADSGPAQHRPGAVRSPADGAILAPFDILGAHVHRDGRVVTFHMTAREAAGNVLPRAAGRLGGAPVYSYVWPTSLDPASVGFEEGSGLLALAATVHPDFDDTPLNDENGDGATDNDGGTWHSHWVVLTPTAECGPGALAVKDIPAGTSPALPATWPGLPLFIDSPGFSPVFRGSEVSVKVSFRDEVVVAGMHYDGVSAALRVHAQVHAPLLCVTDVFDVASGDLSLPGRAR